MPEAKPSKSPKSRKARKRRSKTCLLLAGVNGLRSPDFGIDAIKAKIDTGARTSAIHAFDIRPFTERGVPWVSFVLRPEQRHRNPSIECSAPVVDERKIRSSNGEAERRYVIETEAYLGETVWTIELSLTNRDELGFRMLLGREAVRRQFLVDPDRSYLIDRCYADVTTTPNPKKSK